MTFATKIRIIVLSALIVLLLNSSAAAQVLGVPGPTAPSNGASGISGSVELSWSGVTLATSYQVEVATDFNFNSIVSDQTLDRTSTSVSGLRPGTTYYWRVRSATLVLASGWSVISTFSTAATSGQTPPAAPTLSAPANASTGQPRTITLSWASSSGASSYDLEVATDNGFTSIVSNQTGVGGTSLQVDSLSAGTTYYWRVKAVNSAGASAWSSAWYFNTAASVTPPSAPSLLSPTNGATGLSTTLTLGWNVSTGASSYDVQVSLNGSFSSLLSDMTGVRGTSQQLTGLSAGVEYFWRVQAVNSAGASSWSEVWDFTTGVTTGAGLNAPTLASPRDGSVNEPTSLSVYWNSTTGATSYSLELSADSGFGTLVVSDTGLAQTAQPLNGLASAATYFWRVRATNGADKSAWSSTWRFSTATLPATAKLASPANNDTVATDSVILRWISLPGATSYALEFGSQRDLNLTMLIDIKDTSIILNKLTPGLEYFWRVQGVNSVGGGPWSDSWGFVVKNSSPSLIPPQLVSPPDDAGKRPATDSLVWSPVPGAANYWVQLADSSIFDSLIVNNPAVVGTTVVAADLEKGETYFWRVKSENSADVSGWSGVWKFTTAAMAVPVLYLSQPADGAGGVATTVDFAWNGTTGAVMYALQVADDSTFDSLAVDDSSIATTHFTAGPLPAGRRLYWHVRARLATGSWTPFSDASSFSTASISVPPGFVPVVLRVNYPSFSDASSLKSTDYRLVGLPGAAGLPITSVLSGQPGKSWEAYWDNGTPTNYLVQYLPDSKDSVFRFFIGRAFWIIRSGPLVLDSTLASAPVDSIGGTRIPLHAGWNLITDPFIDSVEWSSVQAADSVTEPIYGFSGAFQISSMLRPGHGYYYFNDSALGYLEIPAPGQLPVPQSRNFEVSSSSGWSVRVALKSEGVVENATWFGVSSAVDSDYNVMDVHKPLGIGSVPAAYFKHENWDKDYSTFADEIHPVFGKMSEWVLTVNSPALKKAQLTFSGLEEVPAEFDAYVFDPVSRSWHDLRKSSSVTFVPQSGTTQFDIVVGKDSVVQDKIGRNSAASIEVGPNYPNPFNPSTTIPIYLSRESHVSVTIFNIIGQNVASVYDGNMGSGDHRIVWNGRDRNGTLAPSGVYFFRVETGSGASLTRKMILLK